MVRGGEMDMEVETVVVEIRKVKISTGCGFNGSE